MDATTMSRALEEVVFQEKQPFKGKEPHDWQEEDKFRKLMVNII
jgi:hypothetical protein